MLCYLQGDELKVRQNFLASDYVGRKYSPKNRYFFASFNNDRGVSLDDNTKDYVDRNTGGQVYSLNITRVVWPHVRWKFAYLNGGTKKNHFSKTEIYFHKKTTPQL